MFKCCFGSFTKGINPENLLVLSCPNKKRSFEPFMCMDLLSSIQFSSRWYLCARKKPICAPSRLSEISQRRLLKRYPMFQGSLQYKRALISLHVVSCRASPYELLRLYSPSRSLRSASDTGIFRIFLGWQVDPVEEVLQYIGPVLWNSHTVSVRHSSSLISFKSKLKTHIFSSASIVFFLLISPTRHQ